MGESPLAVAVDKINIDNLEVNLVSGMTLSVDDVIGQRSKVKSARVTALSDLFVEHQVIMLQRKECFFLSLKREGSLSDLFKDQVFVQKAGNPSALFDQYLYRMIFFSKDGY